MMRRKIQMHLAIAVALVATAIPSAPAAAPVAERVGAGVVRFFPSEAARDSLRPFPGFVGPLQSLGSAPAAFPVQPAFRAVGGRAAAWISTEPGTSLYGTGEVPGPLLRNGRRTTCWNFDAYGWGDASLSLYQSHPWVLAVRADGTSFGVLAATTERCHIDLTNGILFVADGPEFPIVAMDGDSPAAVLRALHALTGGLPLPPLWALGYHQCRYSYVPDARVREVAAGFRSRRIPCDVLWLDIDYMDEYRCFTFDPQTFPAPARLCGDLHEQGFKLVTILDPGIKAEPGYAVFDSGTRFDVWVKRPGGRPFVGNVWPGSCAFPDFTRGATRDWWAGLLEEFLALGIDGLWNDMNEPALFNVDSHTMPLDNLHAADADLGGLGTHARYHNVYGMQMARASWEAQARARPERRPFVLSRANFLGGERWAAAWTGDNTASWYHLEASIPMVLNLGLSGQPWAGPDIGGFAGRGDAQLFARWMGIGALLPFARGHTEKNNIDKEPWAFGRAVEQTCRQALERRYRLLPYIYTQFESATQSGMPVARPLFFADPADPALRSEDDAFLLGGDVLVVAQTSPQARRTVPLPRGAWRRFDLEVGDAGNPELPELWLRDGAVLPVGPVLQYAGERPLDPLELIVCLDAGGRAAGVLYEDEGDGYGYREGRFRRTRFEATTADGWVTLTSQVEAGVLALPPRQVEVRLLLDGREVRATGASEAAIRFRTGP